MSNELLEALNILEQEKNISKETLLEAIENSLVTACKNHFGKSDNVKVEIDPETCAFSCYQEKTVVDTVEDPVEADVDGINQVQVNEKAGLTFASALRSILRQDPDIIMIGEIRDGETAQIAVQAAITGHLVVSTLHTNSAASTITRLEDMGIEPYVVGDAVVGVIAQRLVRRLCPTCKQPRLVEDEERIVLGVPEDEEDVIIYEPSGCPLCNDTGYSGRIGVYEMMPVSKALQAVISTGATADKIEKQALAEGMLTLKMGAAKHVLNGITSMSEMKKIVYTTGDEY